MLKMTTKGFDVYRKILDKLGDEADDVAKIALYVGAEIVADAVRQRIEVIPAVSEEENKKAYNNEGRLYKMSGKQKAGLLAGLGVAKHKLYPMYVDTCIGFDGYNNLITEQYEGGQPNQLIARVFESGTSYSQKQPFLRPAFNSSRHKAEAAMIAKAEECYRNIIKGQGG